MADKNSNPGSKQADGNDDSNVFKSTPSDKESSTGKTGGGSGGMSAGGKIRSEATNDEEQQGGGKVPGKS